MIEILKIREASFKEIAEYVESLPEEEREAVFIAAMVMQGGER